MNDDFVPFELSVKLKEKGYPQRTFGEFDTKCDKMGNSRSAR